MRVALVHDWLTGMRGGEKCLESLCRLFPGADLYTLFYQRGAASPLIEGRRIRTSFLQHVPGVFRWYRQLLPVMPLAISRLRIRRQYDLVVSLSHAVAKSVIPPPGVPHLCYCFTPMRYAWHLYADYFDRGGTLANDSSRYGASLASRAADGVRRLVFARVRRWDRRTAARVTHFVAISRTVEQRIRDAYARPSEVIYPPVDTRFFCPGPERREGFYLCVSALVPYKRIDLAIRACALKDRELVIIGRGPEREALRRMAGPRVRLLGWQSDEIVRHYLRRCRALLFPGREDFGIVPVEAQACGTPVIAYGEGGATEGLVPITSDGSGTAVFFDRQQPESLAAAIAWLEGHRIQFSAALAREQATRFSTARFEAQMAAYLHAVVSGKLPRGGQTDHGGDGIEVHTPHSSLPDPPHRRRVGATHDPGELAQPWQLV